jgi:probable rRNA maturation factor
MQKLNFAYRGKNMPTDVLAFAMNDESKEGIVPEILNNPKEMEVLLGDIIISVETAARQADEYGHSFLREVSFLVTHGALHLLGYDHMDEAEQKEMRQEEEHILSLLNITREI